MSLANIFFKVSYLLKSLIFFFLIVQMQHEDQTVMRHLLVNKEQEQVVNLVIERLQ